MTRSDVLIVVVLYGQSLYASNTYRTLVAENSDVALFVYDNSPRLVHDQGFGCLDVRYVSDLSNPGLSYAYNRAAEYALARGFRWLLITDQDTCFCQGLLNQYIEQINLHPDQVLFVPRMSVSSTHFMSPVRKRFFGNRLERRVPDQVVRFDHYAPINSGMMVSVDAFLRVGGYNERVPLDFSDFQFADRLAQFYPTFFVLDAVCQQEFSNEVQSKEQKLARFVLYCRGAKACKKRGLVDFFSYFCVVARRAVGLAVRTRSFVPLRTFLAHYL